MASGSFTKQVGNRSGTSNEYIKVWWTSTPDPANNRSKVRVYAKMYRPWYLAVDYNQEIELWINGKKYTASRYGWRGKGWTKAYIDKEVWVPHNSDGKKTVEIRLKTQVKAWLRSWVGWVDTGKHKCKLDNLSRKSTFALSSSSATLGDTINVNLSRSSSSVRHKITLGVNTYTKTILAKANDNGTTNSYACALTTADILPHMTGQTATAKVTVVTYNGSTEIGSESKTFTLKLQASNKPAVPSGGLVLTPVPIAPNTSTTNFIQDKSKLKIVINPTLVAGEYGAISTYKVTIDGVTKNYSTDTITTDALNKYGPCVVSVSVIDKRGMESDETSKTIDIKRYSPPLISNFSVARCNANGTLNKSGTSVKVTFKYTFAESGGTNSATITLGDKNTVNSNSYTTKKTWHVTAPEQTISEVFSTYPITGSFDFKLSMIDFYGATCEAFADIGTEEILIDMSEDAVAVGKVAERHNALEVKWKSYFEDTVYATVQANTSDMRRKDLVDNDILELLNIWDELNVVLFKYKAGDDKIMAGVIAQDVIEIFDRHELDWREYGVVYEDPHTGYYSINYAFINQLTMLKAQILQNQLADLARQIDALK